MESSVEIVTTFKVKDLDCVIKKISWGNHSHLCGYVLVPRTHPLYHIIYLDFQLDDEPHGGITYTGFMDNDTAFWWIGFDLNHLYDEESGLSVDLDYCISECIKLALALQEDVS